MHTSEWETEERMPETLSPEGDDFANASHNNMHVHCWAVRCSCLGHLKHICPVSTSVTLPIPAAPSSLRLHANAMIHSNRTFFLLSLQKLQRSPQPSHLQAESRVQLIIQHAKSVRQRDSKYINDSSTSTSRRGRRKSLINHLLDCLVYNRLGSVARTHLLLFNIE